MLFRKIQNFFLENSPLPRVVYTLPKGRDYRSLAFSLCSKERDYRSLAFSLCSKVSYWARRRSWLYLYAFFIILAPFTQINIAHAPLAQKRVEAKIDDRIVKLNSFLSKYNSPMASRAGKFIAVSDRYGLDWRLLPAIAGTESTFGRRIPYGSYNPFGWANGKYRFTSWDQAIETVGKTLYEKYYLKGKRPLTVEQMGEIYAVSPRWPRSVRFWMERIEGYRLAKVVVIK
ncbi:MAG: hypothetical protein BMS9Abin34_397 [Patescibacteria group bacterium]|nr:MAG: hypothetical protein BMS9Abin34_397 [Patescibacteria group bacterium]